MEVYKARCMVNEQIKLHSLEGWSFKFDSAKTRFGQCNYTEKIISLSRPLVRENNEKEVMYTVFHEVAHALVGSHHGHNNVWQQKCIEIGGLGEQYYTCSGRNVKAAPTKYTLKCNTCGKEIGKHKKLKRDRACGKCCNQNNSGKYSEIYKLEVIKNY